MKKLMIMLSILAASCSSTKIVQSWKAPDASYTPEHFQKVLIIALAKDEPTRRLAENKFATRSSNFHASYLIFPNKQIISEGERFQSVITENGFDCIVTLRLLGKDKEGTWVAGSYKGGYWDYRNSFYTAYYQPGYFEENTIYAIETTVFSVKQDKLLWSGISSTTNSSSIKRAVDQVLKEVVIQMKKNKFITEK
jgi:hypothetical protein